MITSASLASLILFSTLLSLPMTLDKWLELTYDLFMACALNDWAHVHPGQNTVRRISGLNVKYVKNRGSLLPDSLQCSPLTTLGHKGIEIPMRQPSYLARAQARRGVSGRQGATATMLFQTEGRFSPIPLDLLAACSISASWPPLRQPPEGLLDSPCPSP